MRILSWKSAAVLGLAAAGAVWAKRGARRKSFSFAGRVVLITGGSRGLGLVLARELAQEGARVALLARDESELARARGDLLERGARAWGVACDLTRRDQVEQAVQRVRDELGPIDAVINNAGLIQVGPLETMTWADFEQAIGLHMFGPLAVMLEVVPEMKRQGGGRIVNIASIAGQVAVPHFAPYVASKFGLVGLSKSFGLELRRHGIYVTTVCPGLMRTGSPPHALFKGRPAAERRWFTITASMPGLSMDARGAARRIIEACRRGQPHLLLSPQDKALVLADALFPNTTSRALSSAAALLPSAEPSGNSAGVKGKDLEPQWGGALTWLTEKAARENNEI